MVFFLYTFNKDIDIYRINKQRNMALPLKQLTFQGNPYDVTGIPYTTGFPIGIVSKIVTIGLR